MPKGTASVSDSLGRVAALGVGAHAYYAYYVVRLRAGGQAAGARAFVCRTMAGRVSCGTPPELVSAGLVVLADASESYGGSPRIPIARRNCDRLLRRADSVWT